MKVISYDDSKKKKVEVEIEISPAIVVLTWKYLGKVKDEDMQDGLRVVPFDCSFLALIVTLVQMGKDDDDLILDVNKSSASLPSGDSEDKSLSFSSIYTTQTNRPIFTGNDSDKDEPMIYRANSPDIVNYSQFDVFSLDIDEEGKQMEDLVVQLFLERS